MRWQWHQLDHYASRLHHADCSRQITTPAHHHLIFTGRRSTNSAKHWMQNYCIRIRYRPAYSYNPWVMHGPEISESRYGADLYLSYIFQVGLLPKMYLLNGYHTLTGGVWPFPARSTHHQPPANSPDRTRPTRLCCLWSYIGKISSTAWQYWLIS